MGPLWRASIGEVGDDALTLLVVVPDDDLRALIGHMLGSSGSDVLVAANAGEALAVAGSAALDLLVAEVAPSFHGRSIAETLRERAPGLAVLYITGHVDFRELADEVVLKTPFSRDQLARAIAAAVRGAPGS
jgi:DNA-binding NtrC family response regulator